MVVSVSKYFYFPCVDFNFSIICLLLKSTQYPHHPWLRRQNHGRVTSVGRGLLSRLHGPRGFTANGSIKPNGSFFCSVGCAVAVAAMPAGFIGRPPMLYPPDSLVVFGRALAMPPIEKVEPLALALGFAPVGLETCGAAADLSGVLD
jgi:hypothetical protein